MSDNDYVVDASAVLAFLFGERFDRFDPDNIANAFICAVNLTEVLTRLQEFGMPPPLADTAVARLNLQVEAFGETDARAAAGLRGATRHAGLSLGDRACLALGRRLGRPVVTADRAWAALDIGAEVILIR